MPEEVHRICGEAFAVQFFPQSIAVPLIDVTLAERGLGPVWHEPRGRRRPIWDTFMETMAGTATDNTATCNVTTMATVPPFDMVSTFTTSIPAWHCGM